MTGSALRLPWTQRLPQQQQQQQLSAGGILITGRSLAWRHRQRAVNDANSLRPFITSSPQPLSVLSGSVLCPHDAPRSVTAAQAWNALPSSVRSAPSLLQFRRDLRTALFQSSYSSP